MSSAATKKSTYDDLLALPEHVVGELIAGELIVSPRPGRLHARSASALGGELFGPFDRGRGGPGGWWILDEPELHFGTNVLVPDLAGWRRERMPRMQDSRPYFDIAPNWVCEVLSKSTASVDRLLKMPIYAREGVEYVWLVDPLMRTLEVFEYTADRWVLAGSHVGDGTVRLAPFAEVELDLSSLWLPDDDMQPGG